MILNFHNLYMAPSNNLLPEEHQIVRGKALDHADQTQQTDGTHPAGAVLSPA